MMNRRRSVLSSTAAGYQKTYANNTSIALAKPANTELLTVAAIGREAGAPA